MRRAFSAVSLQLRLDIFIKKGMLHFAVMLDKVRPAAFSVIHSFIHSTKLTDLWQYHLNELQLLSWNWKEWDFNECFSLGRMVRWAEFLLLAWSFEESKWDLIQLLKILLIYTDISDTNPVNRYLSDDWLDNDCVSAHYSYKYYVLFDKRMKEGPLSWKIYISRV